MNIPFHRSACAALLSILAAGFSLQAQRIPSKSVLEAINEGATVEDALADAREAGEVTAQTEAEAYMIAAIQNDNPQLFGKALSKLRKVRSSYDFEASAIFPAENALRGGMAMAQARLALDRGDEAAFERNIKEAYFKSPELHPLLSQYIAMNRREDTTIDMSQSLLRASEGETTLAKLAEGKRAVLVDFWATWCGPCVRLMPELVKKAEQLEPQGIAVAAINTENRAKASQFRKEHGIDNVRWLVQPQGSSLATTLNVDSIPRMVLLSPEGEVLFNGHPMDEELKSALAKLDVKL
jgi:thiol-disulfide isomerase/thioredoxin